MNMWPCAYTLHAPHDRSSKNARNTSHLLRRLNSVRLCVPETVKGALGDLIHIAPLRTRRGRMLCGMVLVWMRLTCFLALSSWLARCAKLLHSSARVVRRMSRVTRRRTQPA